MTVADMTHDELAALLPINDSTDRDDTAQWIFDNPEIVLRALGADCEPGWYGDPYDLWTKRLLRKGGN